MGSERIVFDTKKRDLGQKLYTDTNKQREVITRATNYQTSSSTLVDIPDTTITFTLEKETEVLMLWTGTIYVAIAASGYIAFSTISIDGADQSLRFFSKDTGKSETGTLFFLENLSAGSHTIIGQLATTDNLGFVEAIISGARLTVIY